jgi:hypothetical protein
MRNSSLAWSGDGDVDMTKRKADYPQTELEITPEICELLEGFTEAEIETGVVAGGFEPAEPRSEGMEEGSFEDLLESLKEASAILRGEKEAARITRFEESGDVTVVVPGELGVSRAGAGES